MATPPTSLTQVFDDAVTLASGTSLASSRYQFSRQLPKPCIHPLLTPSGALLTGFEMSDHVWHRGLWFAIKLINGTNFWEENHPFRTQQTVEQPTVLWLDPCTTRLTHRMLWTSEATGDVAHESRVITTSMAHPQWITIDWSATLTFLQPAMLDRTPFTTWGGYGGMSYRAAREMHDAKFTTPDGQLTQAITGQSHNWVLMTAKVDGGVNRTVSLGMIDHPSNLRSPSPWYCKCASPGFTFMNAAFLFHEPMQVQKDQTLKFNYRMMARDGAWSIEEFNALATTFRNQEVTR